MTNDTKLNRFIALRAAMKKEISWWAGNYFRDAATLRALELEGEPEEIISRLRDPAKILKKNNSGLPILQKESRYHLSAEVLLNDRDPQTFTAAMKAGKSDWKKARLKKDSNCMGAALAVMLLSDKASIDSHDLQALKEAYDRLAKNHRWSIRPNILPLLAFAMQVNPDAADFADSIIPKMRAAPNLGKILVMQEAIAASMTGLSADEVVARMSAIVHALKERKFDRSVPDMPTVALATALDVSPEDLAAEVMQAVPMLESGFFNKWEHHHTALQLVIADHFSRMDNQLSAIAPFTLAMITYLGATAGGDGDGGGGG
ncbi:hypothetical protein FF098_006025 [Parvularcula flava]|uniref:Uncharacterized protein n=1 Tax=Aquisalinus luteolus TaxID=1566827 RepID=A0A8J3A1B8_9PROT|nr:hypothetical protein [Aquisalinus luteolus]NHK27456.1 hypothetical protein [Aquisalinus luteolus]GGH95495.1 hypothetical protein GCM10011355_12170 [Aquisalinus luteolus]